jgi:hypothetical protein
MAVLNLDAAEPYIARLDQRRKLAAVSPVRPSMLAAREEVFANLPLLVGLPVLAVAAGALAWGMMSHPAQTPTTDEAAPAQVAEAQAAADHLAAGSDADARPGRREAAAPAPTQVARAETTRAAARHRPRQARRSGSPRSLGKPLRTPSSASENVSATVPAPVAAPAPTR